MPEKMLCECGTLLKVRADQLGKNLICPTCGITFNADSFRSSWFCVRKGKKEGPFSTVRLLSFAASGRLSPDDMIWTESWSDWKRAGDTKIRFRSRKQKVRRPSNDSSESSLAVNSIEPPRNSKLYSGGVIPENIQSNTVMKCGLALVVWIICGSILFLSGGVVDRMMKIKVASEQAIAKSPFHRRCIICRGPATHVQRFYHEYGDTTGDVRYLCEKHSTIRQMGSSVDYFSGSGYNPWP